MAAVTQHNPKDAAAFASLGVVLSKLEKYEEAASAYHRAIALNPKLPGSNLILAWRNSNKDIFRQPSSHSAGALAADPHSAQARTLLGLSYYGAKRYADAIKYLEPAAKLDPANIELHQVLAQSCLSAKKYPCALDEFHQILQQNPDSLPPMC